MQSFDKEWRLLSLLGSLHGNVVPLGHRLTGRWVLFGTVPAEHPRDGILRRHLLVLAKCIQRGSFRSW